MLLEQGTIAPLVLASSLLNFPAESVAPSAGLAWQELSKEPDIAAGGKRLVWSRETVLGLNLSRCHGRGSMRTADCRRNIPIALIDRVVSEVAFYGSVIGLPKNLLPDTGANASICMGADS